MHAGGYSCRLRHANRDMYSWVGNNSTDAKIYLNSKLTKLPQSLRLGITVIPSEKNHDPPVDQNETCRSQSETLRLRVRQRG